MITVTRNELLAAAEFAAHNDIRKYLTCVAIVVRPAHVELRATDGHVLIIVRSGIGAPESVPGTVLHVPAELIKVAKSWRKADLIEVDQAPAGEDAVAVRVSGAGQSAAVSIGAEYTRDAEFWVGSLDRVVRIGEDDEAPAHYDLDLMVRVPCAAKLLCGNAHAYTFRQRGKYAGQFVIGDQAYGLVMPWRAAPWSGLPAWRVK